MTEPTTLGPPRAHAGRMPGVMRQRSRRKFLYRRVGGGVEFAHVCLRGQTAETGGDEGGAPPDYLMVRIKVRYRTH